MRRDSRAGMNLLELILSIAFCALALLAVMGLQARYQRALAKDEIRSQAEAQAQTVLSRVEAPAQARLLGRGGPAARELWNRLSNRHRCQHQ